MLKALLLHFRKFRTLASRSLDPFRKVKRHQGETMNPKESPSSPTGVASSLSAETGLIIPELVVVTPIPPDPCQLELDELGALMTEYDTFMDDWEPRLLAAAEALECCRTANQGSG
jgi:hypothetical protein